MTGAPDADSDPDGELLDVLFERFVADLGAGRAIDLAAETAARPDLASRIAETLALASEVSFAKPIERPTIAGHEILAELGRGGMGAVYLALERGLSRRVALKVLPASYAGGRRGRERFLREARAVARLKHPNIVPVYELGDEDGVPWFTMEWIEGRTLADVVARQGALDPRRAAAVALDVAKALAHAHAAGVVHRDVKPSNVLIRTDGRALLFDFGLADVAAEASLTLTGAFMGTPHYASPEQAQGRPDLDARTDVWSLGATLYETLVGKPPFTGATTAEVLRKVQHEEPTHPCAADPKIPRDLATVCLTALEKAPAKRYLSAAEFAADLERFLAGEPVAARPVGVVGRAARWVRRKPLVATSAALAVLLVAGTPTALYLQQRAALATIAAQRDKATAFSDAISGIFNSVDPDERGADVKLVDLLAAAAKDARARAKPEIRAALLLAVGEAYATLEAGAAADDALTEARAAFLESGDDASLFRASMQLASVRMSQNRLPEAEAFVREARDAAERSPGAQDDVRPFAALRSQADVLGAQGRLKEAVALLRPAVESARGRLGPDHATTLAIEGMLAFLVFRSEGCAAAMPLFEDLHPRALRVFGADHSETLNALTFIARCARDLGDLDRAEKASRECVDRLAAHGVENSQTFSARGVLSAVLIDRGRPDEAVREARAAADGAVRLLGEGHVSTLRAQFALGRALAARGDADARATLARAHAGLLAASGPDQEHVLEAGVALGAALAKDGDAVRAEPLLRDAAERCAGRPLLARTRAEACGALASICGRTGRPEEAARWRSELERPSK